MQESVCPVCAHTQVCAYCHVYHVLFFYFLSLELVLVDVQSLYVVHSVDYPIDSFSNNMGISTYCHFRHVRSALCIFLHSSR